MNISPINLGTYGDGDITVTDTPVFRNPSAWLSAQVEMTRSSLIGKLGATISNRLIMIQKSPPRAIDSVYIIPVIETYTSFHE
jgi:hypothetical protein